MGVMVMYVNVHCPGIVDIILHRYNEQLIVSEDCNWNEIVLEVISKFNQPHCFC